MRILIADDVPFVRRGVRGILESEGYEVSEAVDGLDAILKVQECNPDLVILDIAMPVKNGLDAAREILRTRPDLPIIILSIHDADQLTRAAKGIRGFVLKSAGSETLLKAIETVAAGGTYFAP